MNHSGKALIWKGRIANVRDAIDHQLLGQLIARRNEAIREAIKAMIAFTPQEADHIRAGAYMALNSLRKEAYWNI